MTMIQDVNGGDPPGACAKCGSKDVIPDGVVFDFDRGPSILQAGFFGHPDALIMKGRTGNSVRARICGHCGHVEMFVEDAKALFKEYVRERRTTQ